MKSWIKKGLLVAAAAFSFGLPALANAEAVHVQPPHFSERSRFDNGGARFNNGGRFEREGRREWMRHRRFERIRRQRLRRYDRW
jgi:hypothetical protein